jgi:hypothetical protein
VQLLRIPALRCVNWTVNGAKPARGVPTKSEPGIAVEVMVFVTVAVIAPAAIVPNISDQIARALRTKLIVKIRRFIFSPWLYQNGG